MRAVRVGLGLLGLAAIAFGVRGIVLGGVATDRPVTLAWLLAGVVLHDAVLLPLVLAAGWLLTRLLPVSVRPPVQAGLFVAGVLVLVAVPVLTGRGGAGNASSNPLDYPRNLAVVLAVVAAGTAAAVAARLARVRRRRPAPAAPEPGPGAAAG